MTDYIPNFEELRKIVDTDAVLFYTVVWVLIIMSASLSSSIAEKKLRARAIHTLFGACLPILYPALISVALPTKSKSMDPKTIKPVNDDKDNLPLDDLNEAYFKSIYLDSEGNHNGPFIIDMEGEIIQANFIAEVHPEFVVVEMTMNTGKKQRIRVPYTKITSCSEA